MEKVVFKVFFTVDTDHFFSIGFEIEQQFKFNVKIVNIIYVRKCAYIVVLIAYVSDVNIFKRFFYPFGILLCSMILFSHILSYIEITSSKASNFKYIEYLAHCICVVFVFKCLFLPKHLSHLMQSSV